MLPARSVVLAALLLPFVASAQSPAAAPPPPASALVAPDVPAGEDAGRDAQLAKIAAGYVDAFSNSGGRFTRDGNGIVFVSSRTGLPQPFVAPVGDPKAAARRLVEWPQRVVVDATTPDGRSVLFRSDKGADENWSNLPGAPRRRRAGGAHPGRGHAARPGHRRGAAPWHGVLLGTEDERGLLGPLLGASRGGRGPDHLPRSQAIPARRREPRRQGGRDHPLPDPVGHAAPPRRRGKRQGEAGLPGRRPEGEPERRRVLSRREGPPRHHRRRRGAGRDPAARRRERRRDRPPRRVRGAVLPDRHLGGAKGRDAGRGRLPGERERDPDPRRQHARHQGRARGSRWARGTRPTSPTTGRGCWPPGRPPASRSTSGR